MAETGERADAQTAPLAGALLAHIVDSDGAARFGLMLAQVLHGLCTAGRRVVLLTDAPELIARLAGTPVECQRLPPFSGWRGWRLPGLLAAALPQPPAVVHLWSPAGLAWVERWATRERVPLVVHVLGARHMARLMRRGLRGPEQIVTLSEGLRAPLVERFPMAGGFCHVIPPAVALPIQTPRPRAAGGTLGVVAVTCLDAQGGLEVLVDAAAQLRRSALDLQVAVLGSGSGAGALARRIRAQGVRDCISVVNEPGLWDKVVPEVDVCVVPACQRELWLAPLLAMGLGKVVIASRDQPAPWYVEDRTAWQFTSGSAVELAYLLARAVEQPKHAEELGASAAEYVRAEHAVGDLIARLLDLYALVAGGEPAGSPAAGLERSGGAEPA